VTRFWGSGDSTSKRILDVVRLVMDVKTLDLTRYNNNESTDCNDDVRHFETDR